MPSTIRVAHRTARCKVRCPGPTHLQSELQSSPMKLSTLALPLSLVAAVAVAAAVTFLLRAAPGSGERKVADSPTAPMNDFKKPDAATLRAKLTAEQFAVTQKGGTEPPFRNEYWDNHAAGIYVDVVSGEPLFSSLDKFESGTGWPSFTAPIAGTELVLKSDRTLFMKRTEVRSKLADSHLGHVFDDGPADKGGQRYCMNSASMRFVPVADLEKSGYGKYAALFAKAGAASGSASASASAVGTETAILAGGCFWGMEEILRKIPGVQKTTVGYTGGTTANPTYHAVCTGETGHAEAIEVVFDSSKLSYEALLGYFFRMHDPTTLNRQHNDVGTQYRSAIFVTSEAQRATAQAVKSKLSAAKKFSRPITTEITTASRFYSAEDYHQKYLIKNPDGYNCHILRSE